MSFIDQYFINPIYADSGYNLVNSITYALLAILGLFLVYKLLEKLKVKIDRRFFFALLPFIILGSLLRALVDSEIYKICFWTVSPGIYLIVTFMFLIVLGISLFAKENYWGVCSGVGLGLIISLIVLNISKIEITNIEPVLKIISIATFAGFLLWLVSKKAKWMQNLNFFPLPAHMLDASATFIAVDFLGFAEKHPLPKFLTELTGTAAIMFVLKLAVLLPAIYLIHKEIKSQNLRNYLFIAIATLGFAEGLRNLFTILI